ncbi:MAG: phosphate transport system regulatory protein PhoU, partial [Nitrospirae bacterium CG01_land_8_20_14_3_00_44_22]
MSVFDEELQHLKENVLKLGSMVEKAISDSIKSLVERNSKLAVDVIDKDLQLNALDVEIDEECIRLIALRQPRAGDLRLITTAMKITTDLERIGDLAVDVSERALELNEEPQLKPYIDIPRMTEIAQGMVRDALDAFVKRDSALARDVLTRDDLVDNLNWQVFNELLFFMIQDPKTV